jgi:hypothetical protein
MVCATNVFGRKTRSTRNLSARRLFLSLMSSMNHEKSSAVTEITLVTLLILVYHSDANRLAVRIETAAILFTIQPRDRNIT